MMRFPLLAALLLTAPASLSAQLPATPPRRPAVAIDTVHPPLASRQIVARRDALLPKHRIIAYYGNPLSTRMGILGEIPP
ncbi:MAG: hypothetical protein IPP98_11285 [Gemmatimonadetes bacterium]|nr:hypothetical protein [Gemmatimonadota bacterium]